VWQCSILCFLASSGGVRELIDCRLTAVECLSFIFIHFEAFQNQKCVLKNPRFVLCVQTQRRTSIDRCMVVCGGRWYLVPGSNLQ
jgi:hypothetical protein